MTGYKNNPSRQPCEGDIVLRSADLKNEYANAWEVLRVEASNGMYPVTSVVLYNNDGMYPEALVALAPFDYLTLLSNIREA